MLRADFFQRALPWTDLILRDRQCINDLNTGMSGRASLVLMASMLCSLVAAPWHPRALALTSAAAVALLMLNVPLYRFFLRGKGDSVSCCE